MQKKCGSFFLQKNSAFTFVRFFFAKADRIRIHSIMKHGSIARTVTDTCRKNKVSVEPTLNYGAGLFSFLSSKKSLRMIDNIELNDGCEAPQYSPNWTTMGIKDFFDDERLSRGFRKAAAYTINTRPLTPNDIRNSLKRAELATREIKAYGPPGTALTSIPRVVTQAETAIEYSSEDEMEDE
jgi:hypothetical protein